MSGQLRLRVLTLNIWALPIPLPREDRAERMARLPDALRSVDADIIMLQEALHPRDRDAVVRALARDGYTATATATRRLGGLLPMDASGGLLTLSRFPLDAASYHPLPVPAGAKWTERMSGKGVLRCVVRTPLGPVTCVNVHLYAGTTPADRAARLEQLHAAPLEAAPGSLVTVLAGDLNATVAASVDGMAVDGPEIVCLTGLGFRDVVRDGAPGSRLATYAVRSNRYAAMWADPARGDERLDFILYRPAGTTPIGVREVRVVFDESAALVSDHYGVQADLALG